MLSVFGLITLASVIYLGSTCSLQPAKNATLIHLSPVNVMMVNATAEECCALCASSKTNDSNTPCASWSFSGDKWSKGTPCHLSPYAIVSSQPAPGKSYCGGTRPDAPPAPPSPPHPGPSPVPPTPGHFVIDTSAAGQRQVFEGIQVELMSDSIGSYNQGMPGGGELVPDDDASTLSAPHDLTPAERVRFATEVMRGVRTIRLAMGLYLRGLSADNKSIVGRWPSQMSELKQLQELSGIDGWAPEYWSPPPFWKSSGSYYGGTLKSFNESFLDAFSDAVVQDVTYLQQAGLRVRAWGLQNEPNFDHTNFTGKCNRTNTRTTGTSSGVGDAFIGNASQAHAQEGAQVETQANTYSTCHYDLCSYYFAFAACAKKIRQLDPTIRIHANSATGQLGASAVANDPETLALVDAWTWHHVGQGSSATFKPFKPPMTESYAYGKLDFTNEMEYQPGSQYAGTQVGTVSNVNIFLNTLTFLDAPTGVMMLHACKPTTNLESLGYGWTWWRSTGDNTTSPNFPSLKPNHWSYNWYNWNSVAPFIKTVPWNSVRRDVVEDVTRPLQRVVAFETPAAGEGGPLHQHTPAGKLIVVLTNEGSTEFNASIATSDGAQRTWRGYSFQGAVNDSTFNVSLGTRSMMHSTSGPGQRLQVMLSPFTIQWWYEQ